MLVPDLYIPSIYELTPEHLKKLGICGLILDIDNTMVPYHTMAISDRLLAWIQAMRGAGISLSIVSNGRAQRVGFYSSRLDIPFAFASALKPLSMSLKKAMAAMGTTAETTAIVGDQIYTDVLGGNLLGIYTILVKPIRAECNPLFGLKRLAERPVLAQYRRRMTRNES